MDGSAADTSKSITKRASYFGLVDDMVQRFPFVPDAVLTREVFDDMFIEQALFGSAVLLNDGIPILTDAGVEALLEPDCSPFLDFIETGFVRIIRRTTDAWASMPEKYKISVPNYKGVSEREGWKALARTLSRLESGKDWDKLRILTPRVHLSQSFIRLIEPLRYRSAAELDHSGRLSDDAKDRVFDSFAQECEQNPTTGARTLWQRAVEDPALALHLDGQHALMRLGNETYHYNQALCLAPSVSDHWRVGVVTRRTPFFENLCADIDSGQCGIMAAELPVPKLPERRMLREGRRWREAFESPNFWRCKDEYLAAVEEVRTAHELADNEHARRAALAPVRHAAARYEAELAKHFAAVFDWRTAPAIIAIAATAGGTKWLAQEYRAANQPQIPDDVWTTLEIVSFVVGLGASVPLLPALKWWRTKVEPAMHRWILPHHNESIANRILKYECSSDTVINLDRARAHVADLPPWVH